MKTTKFSYLSSITSKEVKPVDLKDIYNLVRKGHPLIDGDTEKEKCDNIYKLKTSQKLPVMAFSVLCEGGHSKTKIKQYTHFFCGDIDHLESEEEAQRVKTLISSNPNVSLAFISPSRKGVKFVIRLHVLARPTNILENTNDNNRFTLLDNYHKSWFTIISTHFKEKYNIELDPQCCNVNRLCYLSYDPQAYYNSKALPYEFEEPYKELFEIYLNLSPKNPNEIGHRNTLLYSLNLKAKENNVSEDTIREFAEKYFTLSNQEIDNALKNEPNFTKSKNKSTKTKEIKNQEIIDLFNQEYKIRNNIVIECFQISHQDKNQWEQLDEIQENTIFKHITNTYPQLTKTRIMQLIKTDDVEKYDVLQNYFTTLEKWDEIDHIHNLAKSIQTHSTKLLEEDLKKWLVGIVATVMEKKVVNNFCFVLAGKEGTGKSTFFTNIVPPQLRDNHFQDNRLDIKHKDLNFKLSQNLIINLEEFDKYTKAELPEIKSMITSHNIQERPHYGKNQKKYIRRCSFCATINKTNFLSGEEGERRFLVHEVLSMNYQYQINHTQLYSQIFELYKKGYKYWEAGEEIQERKKINKQFQETSATEELFFKYYRKPTQEEIDRKSLCLKVLTSTDIKIKLCQNWGINSNDVSSQKIGKILNEQEYIKKIIRGSRRYVVFEKTDTEIKQDQEYYLESPTKDEIA